MNLASKPCYPITPEQYYAVDEHPEVTGLTFRERLIISLASNPQMFYMTFDDDGVPQLDWDDDAFEKNAGNIKRQADAIINQLTKE